MHILAVGRAAMDSTAAANVCGAAEKLSKRAGNTRRSHLKMSRGKLIIIEGVDQCGKSEISHALAARLGYTYFKNDAERREFGSNGSYFINTLRYGLTYFLSFLRQSDVGVIFDRCYPSEFTYAKAFGRETDWDVLRECDDEMARLGAVIVIAYRTSYDGISDDSHPHLIGPKRLKELDTLYQEFARWTHVPVLWLNVDDENLEREVSEVETFLRQRSVGGFE